MASYLDREFTFQEFMDVISDYAYDDLDLQCNFRNVSGNDEYTVWGECTFVVKVEFNRNYYETVSYYAKYDAEERNTIVISVDGYIVFRGKSLRDATLWIMDDLDDRLRYYKYNPTGKYEITAI